MEDNDLPETDYQCAVFLLMVSMIILAGRYCWSDWAERWSCFLWGHYRTFGGWRDLLFWFRHEVDCVLDESKETSHCEPHSEKACRSLLRASPNCCWLWELSFRSLSRIEEWCQLLCDMSNAMSLHVLLACACLGPYKRLNSRRNHLQGRHSMYLIACSTASF